VKPILLVRNDAFESFGLAAPALAWAGADVLTANLPAGAGLPPLSAVGGVVMFGGTANVDQTDEHPHLGRARACTKEALDAGVPYLGICLGSQILARVCGRTVGKGPVKECGFEPITPTPDGGRDPLVSLYSGGDHVVQWHEDTFELPEGATLLATGERIRVQAYRVGASAWGIQFHQEVDSHEFGSWVDIASAEIDLAAVWGKSPDRLREEACEHMAAHERRGRELFSRFAEVVKDAGR